MMAFDSPRLGIGDIRNTDAQTSRSSASDAGMARSAAGDEGRATQTSPRIASAPYRHPQLILAIGQWPSWVTDAGREEADAAWNRSVEP